MVKQINQNKFSILVVLGIILIAVNLRPAITSVGPLIGIIRDDVGFQNWSVALLTSLPLIAFAIMSPIAPMIANKFTNEWALVFGLLVLTIGLGFRSISIMLFLFFGTLCIGFGIAILNVLLPGVIKEKFPHKVAIMTSIYTTTMAIFATSASGVSIPISENLGWGWQLSLLVWVIPACIGLIIWFTLAIKNKKQNNQDSFLTNKKGSGIWKSKLAWFVALFMGLQSLMFYVTISWLAEIVISFGFSQEASGYFVSYVQLVGIPVSFIMPILALKLKSQSMLVLSINSLYIIGILLLLLNQSFAVVVLAVGLIGISSSSNFALALTFLSIRAKNPKDSADLSGMAQSMGYILAATGPIFIGYLFDLTGSWTMPLISLIIVTVLIIFFGIRAGRDEYVLDN